MASANYTSEESQRRIDIVLTHMDQHGTITVEQVQELLGAANSTAAALLRHMHLEARVIQREKVRIGKANVWRLGADTSLEDLDAPKRRIAPAVQIGMWRDSLVAALFGAGGVAA